MKKLVLLLSIILISFSCTQKGQYVITGTTTLPEMEGKYVYLNKYNADGVEKSDSVVVKDGKFAFKGIQEAPVVYYILTGDDEESMKKYPILLEPGKMTVTIGDEIAVSGTPANDSYKSFVESQSAVQTEMDEIDKEFNKAKEEDGLTPELQQTLEGRYDSLYENMKGIYTQYLVTGIKNPLGQEILGSVGRRLNTDQLAKILANADSTYKSSETGSNFVQRLDNMQKTAVGQKFVDIVSKTPDGKDISLSEYAGKGKYVLLDFWASWCPPCRAEMPNLVVLYAKYKSKNFEIVGYSLDKNEDAWKKGLEELKMTWPQMSDVKYWQSEPVKLYAVQGIPHTILIDPNGVIINKDLRGEDLAKKLEELLK